MSSIDEPGDGGSGPQPAPDVAGVLPHRLPATDAVDWEGIRGSTDGTGLRIALACSRFNGQVTGLLLAGALAELDRCGVAKEDRTVIWVSGAFELPLVAMAVARTGRYDAIICLGAVIRGETSHYELVAGECAAGIQRIQLDMSLPVVFGVLTTDNLAQALARAGGALGNKGTEAAMTAIEMVNVLRKVKWNRPGSPDRASTAQKTQ
jgi:6,7-dimethyl-8-ribityllumazine synthase